MGPTYNCIFYLKNCINLIYKRCLHSQFYYLYKIYFKYSFQNIKIQENRNNYPELFLFNTKLTYLFIKLNNILFYKHNLLKKIMAIKK